MKEKAMVCVGPPFEQQTFYGPFDIHDEVCEWADKSRNDYTWILTLHDPDEP